MKVLLLCPSAEILNNHGLQAVDIEPKTHEGFSPDLFA
jgi:hypothetical protein